MIFRVRVVGLLALLTCALAPVALAAPRETEARPSAAAPQDIVASSESDQTTLTVSVRVLPPFVEHKNGQFTGYSVDLWKAIASQQGWKTSFKVAPDVKGQLEDVASGAADVGVGAISIPAGRALRYDFSQPIMNAGLQILVHSDRRDTETTALGQILRLLFSPAILIWMGIALLLAAIPAHVIWFLERNHNTGIIKDSAYFPGIFQGLYWGVSSITGREESMPRQWIARIFALIWSFASIVFVAYYTAQLTASLTVERFKSEISGPQDLPGKAVGTVQASTSAAYLDSVGAKVATFPTIEAAYQALIDNRVDAVVYDAPVLQYTPAKQGAVPIRTVGPIFKTADYGFVFTVGSNLRKRHDFAPGGLAEERRRQRQGQPLAKQFRAMLQIADGFEQRRDAHGAAAVRAALDQTRLLQQDQRLQNVGEGSRLRNDICAQRFLAIKAYHLGGSIQHAEFPHRLLAIIKEGRAQRSVVAEFLGKHPYPFGFVRTQIVNRDPGANVQVVDQ
eukprot:gene30694-40816_t